MFAYVMQKGTAVALLFNSVMFVVVSGLLAAVC
jgi:hypothetical protein